jgi:transposase
MLLASRRVEHVARRVGGLQGCIMPAAFSQDLRDKVLHACDRGVPTAHVADVFGVSASWVRRVKQVRREQQRTAPLPMGGKRFQKIDRVKLAELVAVKPDATLRELREALGVVCAISAIDKALRQLKLSFKKRRSTRLNKTGPTLRFAAQSGSSGVQVSTRDA